MVKKISVVVFAWAFFGSPEFFYCIDGCGRYDDMNMGMKIQAS